MLSTPLRHCLLELDCGPMLHRLGNDGSNGNFHIFLDFRRRDPHGRHFRQAARRELARQYAAIVGVLILKNVLTYSTVQEIDGACAHSFCFAFSPISTRRRIASGRDGSSGCLRRQSSINASSGGCHRRPISVPVPVLVGRPRDFLLSLIDDFMTTC